MGTSCSVGKIPSNAESLPPKLPSLKIALVGDPGVGKTSILLRYLRNQFSPLYIPTKKVAIETVVRKLNVPANTVVSLTFWDIPGREDMDVHKSYFRNLDAAIVVVDLTNKSTMDMANVWKQTVLNKLTTTVALDDGSNNNNNGEVLNEVPVDPVDFPVLLLGNKFDIIEDEIYQTIATKQVSASMDLPAEFELTHEAIDHFRAVAEKHNFIGSVTVSARQSDNNVIMAILSLVRNILEKRNIPRKWKPVPEKSPKEDKPFIYDKLEKTDIDKVFKLCQYSKLDHTGDNVFDKVIEKADNLVKQTVMLRHYYTVSLARFKYVCKQAGFVDGEPSLEDCIAGLKSGLKDGSLLQITQDEGFYKLDVSYENEHKQVKQSKPWKEAYKVFHNEYAAVAKAILAKGPDVTAALDKYDLGLEKMHNDYLTKMTNDAETINNGQAASKVNVGNKIVYNRAKIVHARDEMQEAMKEVVEAGQKISNVNCW